jgi:hypothetical protein
MAEGLGDGQVVWDQLGVMVVFSAQIEFLDGTQGACIARRRQREEDGGDGGAVAR